MNTRSTAKRNAKDEALIRTKEQRNDRVGGIFEENFTVRSKETRALKENKLVKVQQIAF